MKDMGCLAEYDGMVVEDLGSSGCEGTWAIWLNMVTTIYQFLLLDIDTNAFYIKLSARILSYLRIIAPDPNQAFHA